MAIQSPEAILDVPLCHEDHSIVVGLSECMDEHLKQVTQLVNSAPGSSLLQCVVDRINESPILQMQFNGEVQDLAVGTRLVGYCCYQGDLEMPWVVPLDVVPQDHTCLPPVDLCGHFLPKVCKRVRV